MSLLVLTLQGSNNTNKLSPQEQLIAQLFHLVVQIIQINLVLKNHRLYFLIHQVFK